MKKPGKAALILALIALGFLWRPAWVLLVIFLIAEWAEDRWKELLEAIRGTRRRSPKREQEQNELQQQFEQQQTDERLIEAAHQKSEYKHVPDLPWGDPGSYVKASTPEELARLVHEREIAQDRRNQEEQKREQGAREFLIHESERVQREREERAERQKTKQREPVSESVQAPPAPLMVIRPPSSEAAVEMNEATIALMRNAGWLEQSTSEDTAKFHFVDLTMTIFPDGSWECEVPQGSTRRIVRGSAEDLKAFLAKFEAANPRIKPCC